MNTEEIKGHIKDVFQRSEFGERLKVAFTTQLCDGAVLFQDGKSM